MKHSSIFKAINKVATVKLSGTRTYTAKNNYNIITWIDQEGEAICIRVRSKNDKDEMVSDYTAGVFVDTIKEALKYFIN